MRSGNETKSCPNSPHSSAGAHGKDPAWERGYSSIATGTHKYNYKTLLVNEPTGCESLPSQLVVLSTTASGTLFDCSLA